MILLDSPEGFSFFPFREYALFFEYLIGNEQRGGNTEAIFTM